MTEKKRYLKPFIRGVITGCVIAVLGIVLAVELINNGYIYFEVVPIVLTVITIAGISLATGSMVYYLNLILK